MHISISKSEPKVHQVHQVHQISNNAESTGVLANESLKKFTASSSKTRIYQKNFGGNIMQTLEQQYKEFEKTQDAIDKGIPARDIPRYLQLTQEEKEDYIKYLQETGKDRL